MRHSPEPVSKSHPSLIHIPFNLHMSRNTAHPAFQARERLSAQVSFFFSDCFPHQTLTKTPQPTDILLSKPPPPHEVRTTATSSLHAPPSPTNHFHHLTFKTHDFPLLQSLQLHTQDDLRLTLIHVFCRFNFRKTTFSFLFKKNKNKVDAY